MQALFGVLFHFIGGFASGSFYIPYKKVRGWAWETYWIVGGLFSWLIMPPLAAWLTIPNFSAIIAGASGSTLFYTYLFGLLWGIGGLTYGLGVRYLGVSLGSSIILGITMVLGSMVPSFYFQFFPQQGKDTIGDIVGSTWGLTVLTGMVVCVAGIVLCGKAGIMKERQLKAGGQPASQPKPVPQLRTVPVTATVAAEAGSKAVLFEHPIPATETQVAGTPQTHTAAATEYRFGLGITVAIISGLLSACFNFGIEAGKPMADLANSLWQNAHPDEGAFLYQNNVTYVVILWGGLTTNLLWCLFLNLRNKTLGDYTNTRLPLLRNLLFSALAGTTWFLQFFFYGMGESRLGNGPSSWILHMAFIILTANAWGLALKEWKGVSKGTRMTIIAGIMTIILSVLLVGYGNSLKE